MKMCLAMETADGGERCFPISQDRLVIGRDPRCDLRVAVPSVSTRHCEILTEGNVLCVSDLGSATGTFHNGIRILKSELAPHDRVTIGSVTFVVRPESPADSLAAMAEVKPQPRAARARPASASSAEVSTEG
ncbi:MAG: FHA domain-containing protein [Planctomycetota bacterium]|jgi:pSer/pThr/pTyr-binding forkhead associated (FHA) protein